jgi:WD40 repeat protein
MVRLIVNYQNRKYSISVDVDTFSVGQFRERVMMTCGVPVGQQKIFGLPANQKVPLSRLNIVDGQQFLLYRTKYELSGPATVPHSESVDGDDSVWEVLPGEVQFLIFGLLDPWTMLTCSRVSKGWSELAKDNWIWEEKFHRRWTTLTEMAPPTPNFPWRSLYFEHHRLQRNWVKNKIKVHSFPMTMVFMCMDYREHGYQQIEGGAGVSSSSAPSASFFESDTQQLKSQYQLAREDSMFVGATALSHHVVLGNVWTGEQKKELRGHSSDVLAVSFAGLHHVISTDTNGNMFLWDIHRSKASLPWSTTSAEFVGRRNLELGGLCSLRVSGSNILVGGQDGSVAVLDLNQSMHPLTASRRHHENTVTSISAHADNNIFATSGLDGYAKIWDMRSGEAVMSLYADNHDCLQVQFGWPHQLLTCGGSGVRMWDTRTANTLAIPARTETTSMFYDGSSIVMAGRTRTYFAQLDDLGIPIIDHSLDYSSPEARNATDLDVELRQYSIPLPNVTGPLFVSPWNLVSLSSSHVTGVDFSSQNRRIERVSNIFDDDL